MDGLRLYERYDRQEAVALFGTGTEARSRCDGQWVILPEAVLGFADLGEPPKASHFTCGGEFCWVARKRYRVGHDQHSRFVPPQLTSRHADRPIHLLVRPSDSGRHLYVGELSPACRFKIRSDKGNHGEAYFSLSPALPSDVWGEIGGYQPGDLDHASIDSALERLRQPLDVEERLWVLRRLVAYWHGPIRPEDGFREDDLEKLKIPYPLRWWYRWAGRRREVMSGQNHLLDPDRLMAKDDRLVFYGENQWCYEWATLFEGDDPPVYGREDDGDPWEPEGILLSEHLILACLFEATTCHSRYGAAASWLEESILNRIIDHIPPVPINPWRWTGATRFYAGGGAFMYTMTNGQMDGKQGYSVWIGAKTEHPLQFLKPFIDDRWEYVAI